MLIQALMNLAKALLLAIINLFPTIESNLSFSSYLKPLETLFHGVNMVVDVSLFGTCLLFIITVYNARFLWSIIMWVVRKIPGVS